MKAKIWALLVNILYYLPKKMAHKILYKIVMKKDLNLNKPKDINEKIQWLILNKYGKKEAMLADKLMVKEILSKKGYGDIIPKVYKVYDKADEICLESLPEKFILKTNNGCGHIFVCDDKNSFDIKNSKKELNKAMKTNFAKINLEYHYSLIKPKIICEEYLDDGTGNLPIDYKFYCFNGKVDCILVCTDRIDENNKTITYYDTKWNRLYFESKEYISTKEIKKPENLDEMIEIASKLSVGHRFVRVDLYNLNGKVYFGELTFTPACGMIQNLKQEALDYLGDLIDLKNQIGEENE